MIHTVNSFSIVSEAEVDVFLEFPSTIQQMARCSQIQIHGLLPKSNTVFLWCSENYIQVRKQQLEMDMEQQTGSK